MRSKEANSIAEYVHRLEEAREKPSAPEVLRELCRLFDVTAIGLNAWGSASTELVVAATGNVPPAIEWHADADLMQRMQASLTCVPFTDQAGSWLLCPIREGAGDEPLVAWLQRRSAKSSWNENESFQWLAASRVLARLASRSTPGGQDVKQIARRLDQAAALTGRLTHDFGNYLTGILGFTELSLSQTSRESSQYRFLQEVLNSAQQGAAWIRRLQLFCRRGTAPIWPTRLATLLATEEARGRSAEGPNLRWDVQLPGDLPLLEIDASALQTILQELVSNTKDATKNKGTISFTARTVELSSDECKSLLGSAQPGPHVELTVADDGPGMDRADREKLYREFFFSTKPRGRGVGLLVVYGILQRFRGGLQLDNSEPRNGMRLRIYLPTSVLEEPTGSAGSKPPNVLLAHGNPVVFETLRIMLEAQGCRVTTADSPQAALAAYGAKKASVALVVVDVSTTQMSGYDLARRILDQDSKANFIFVHTEQTSHSSADEGALSEYPLLRWPLQPAGVLRTIRTALMDSAD